MKTLHKIVLIFGLSSIANALSMQEAVMLALNANHTIKQQEFLLQESKASYRVAQSAFYPSINATYGTLKSNRIQRANKTTSANLGANITYNLFNGFSDVYHLKSAKALVQSQDFELEATKEDVMLLVKSAYIDVLRQAQHLKIAKESKKLLEEQKRQNSEFYRVGFIHKNDLLKVEVELNNTIQDLLRYESALNYALQNLKRFVKVNVRLEDLQEINAKKLNLSFALLKEKMLRKRSELLLLDKVIESKGYLVASAKGNFLPDIVLSGNYTRYGDDYKLSGRDGVYKDATNINLSFSLNLFNGFSDRYALESAKMTELSYKAQRNTLLEDLDLQLFNALESYHLALNAFRVSEIALNQAEENYRISKNRYSQRIETTSDFLDAELLLSEAKTNVVLNRYAIIESLAQLERITQTELMQKP